MVQALRQLAALAAAAGLFAGCAHSPKTPTAAAAPEASAPKPTAPESTEARWTALAAKPSAPLEGEGWRSLFDGGSLTGWLPIDFGGQGGVDCLPGMMVLNMGDPFTGIKWTNEFPRINYEIALDATRLLGSDFFCGLTVPVGTNQCSLIVGGWGGGVVGISSLNSLDASENETTKFMRFDKEQWYRIRMRVTTSRIEVWIDQEKTIDVSLEEKRVSLRPGEIERCVPLGIAAWQTSSGLRGLKWRAVDGPADPKKPKSW